MRLSYPKLGPAAGRRLVADPIRLEIDFNLIPQR
jgi:hypothetical protein